MLFPCTTVGPVPAPQVLGLEPPQPVPHYFHGEAATCHRLRARDTRTVTPAWGVRTRDTVHGTTLRPLGRWTSAAGEGPAQPGIRLHRTLTQTCSIAEDNISLFLCCLLHPAGEGPAQPGGLPRLALLHPGQQRVAGVGGWGAPVGSRDSVDGSSLGSSVSYVGWHLWGPGAWRSSITACRM